MGAARLGAAQWGAARLGAAQPGAARLGAARVGAFFHVMDEKKAVSLLYIDNFESLTSSVCSRNAEIL